MNPKLKNAIIFIVIGIAMVAIYLVFIKKDPEQSNLTVSSQGNAANPTASTTSGAVSSANVVDSGLSKDFLSVLLSIQNITLDDSIFSDLAFMNLKDSTILLVPDGSEGRPNPFAPIGSESNSLPASALTGFGVVDNTITAPANTLETINISDPVDTAPATSVKTNPATTPKKTTTPKP